MARTCTIPMSIFYQATYSMVLGDRIYIRVIAINSYGESLASTAGDGSAIIFLPDAPINLANNAAITSSNTIGLTW
jgi:hypothetical protein